MSSLQKQKGFTIVELLIVIVVIGILAAITIVAFNGIQTRGYDGRRTSDVSNVKKALELYKADEGQYPAACGADNSGCQVSALSSFLVPKYIASLPQDPKSPARSYDYVRGPLASDSYAIRIYYEGVPSCKTGNNVNAGWWGALVPVC
ncbi:MAG: prepilin-type N-terminal cleavage/methylation domain-containing protein [Pedobacter sp.]|nr:MAG: prepilin-type N-terminal cleavage/methylation domain-containing protein [Pedobacter sp.]